MNLTEIHNGAQEATNGTPGQEPEKSTFDVIMLTSVHSATDDRIFHREAKTLVEAGFSVAVVGRHVRSEYLDGIWVDALPAVSTRSQRMLLGWTVLIRGLRLGGKLFFIHDPELLIIGLLLRCAGKQVVYDCHENLYLQVLQKTWIPKWARWALVPVLWTAEWLASRMLSGVVVAVDSMTDRFPRGRTIAVRNYPTTGAMKRLTQGPPLHLRADVVIYAGGLSRIRGIRELVEAFRGPELKHAHLWLVGAFEDSNFEQEILASLPANVQWLGWREHTEVLELYQEAKIGAILLHPTPSHRRALPVKLLEYFGAGLPVVASNYPELSSMVGECGLCVDPVNPVDIRRAIVSLLSNPAKMAEMSAKTRARAMSTTCWEKEAERLINFCATRISARSD
jgi:glycosyltransferase involved in cell wall biosynthesis